MAFFWETVPQNQSGFGRSRIDLWLFLGNGPQNQIRVRAEAGLIFLYFQPKIKIRVRGWIYRAKLHDEGKYHVN